MSSKNLRSITNSFQDVRLGSLASWSRAGEFTPHDPGGPYVVTQEGCDPDDATFTPNEFILCLSGDWLSLTFFFQMPEPSRTDFIFRTAAEVMQVIYDLPPQVQIIRPGTKEKATHPPEVNELAAVLQDGKCGATGAASRET